ncbi:OmpA family protein [Flavobacterium gilvum]|uniref:OmpA-like domain-containing protein n=1 Tax=Flavobacterium gilvum TaxID=1492737 RepID=A0AAC9N7J2_9FLAO|nr:OmpA family protein [Flavobacterium gilvum]AOW10588.1 hypothetical protein EM308_14415 [Flavobacterium gilvum]KFC58438.1 hypothetical protein FEM08_27870 [Flavobacterium gilvum]
MKRKFLSVFTIAFSMTVLMAQEKNTTTNFNRWSIDLNGGSSKPAEPFNEGYYSDDFNFNHGDLGVRYMLNTKFGLKADFGLDNMKDGHNSLDFNTKYYRTDLQGIINLGRICNFETWTRVFGLQGHAGVGYSWMTNKNFEGRDNMVNLIVGLTGQVKLSNRFALNADFSRITNVRQDINFNGVTAQTDRTFDGVLYNATLGLSYYIGKQKVHADWYSQNSNTSTNANDELLSQIGQLENKLNETESKLKNTETKLDNAVNKLKDSDNDGVADYLDVEPNSKPGAVVDTKGRTIDFDKSKKETVANTNESSQNLSDINVYFNTNSYNPTNKSRSNIDIVTDYLKANQHAKVEINGYSDNKGGNSKGNKILSQKRADTVKKILVKSGVKATRLSAHGKGVDLKSHNAAKKRHVSFKIK